MGIVGINGLYTEIGPKLISDLERSQGGGQPCGSLVHVVKGARVLPAYKGASHGSIDWDD